MRGAWALFEREVVRYFKVWTQTIVPPILTAVVFVFIFGVSLGERIRLIDGVPYVEFIAPGLVMNSIINSAYSNTSSSLYDSRMRGYIEDVLVAPISDAELALAYVLSAASRGIIVGAGTLLAIWWATDLAWTSLLLVFYYAVAVSIFFGCVGAWFGLWGDRWDHVFAPITFFLTPLTFLGGVFYSVKMLPGIWREVSLYNPIFYMVDGIRYGMIGVHDAPILPGAIGVGLAALLSLLVTVRVFRTGYKLRQ